MLLWVLADNGSARRFYESLGGRMVKEEPLSKRQIARFVSGGANPREGHLVRLMMLAKIWEKVGRNEQDLMRYMAEHPSE